MNLTVSAYEALLRSNPDLHAPDLPRPRRGLAPTEHEEQAAVIAWARQNEARLPDLALLFAVPNGGHRDKATARLLAAEGVRAGVPDLCMPVMRHGCGALWIELKRRDFSNHLSAEQASFVAALRRAGHRVVVAYGAPAAIEALLAYLGSERVTFATPEDGAMSDLTPTQMGATLIERMLRHGPINAAEEAQRMGVSRSSVYRALEDLSALHTVAVANDRGWWYVNLLDATEFDTARRMLVQIRAEIGCTPPGTLFCRAMRRSDMVQLERLLCRLVERRPEREPEP